MRKILILNEGVEVLVSDEDYYFTEDLPLRTIHGSHSSKLISYLNQGITYYLHVEIARRAGLDCSNEIDHRDLNYLNNQRENLRAATKSQNQQNQEKPKNNTSGFKGVTRCKQTGLWQARIWVNGRPISLGRHLSAEIAAGVYDHFAREYHGEFARLNFPKESEQQA
jgi:hypothetical protein